MLECEEVSVFYLIEGAKKTPTEHIQKFRFVLKFNHMTPLSTSEVTSLFVVLLIGNLLLLLSTKRSLLGGGIGLSLLVGLLGGLLEGLVEGGELGGLGEGGVLADGGVHLLEQLLEVISLQAGLQVLGEVLLVVLLIVLLHLSHVVGDVLAHDAGLVHLSVELLGVSGVTGEALVAVGDVQAAIAGALQGTEDLGTGGGVLDSNVQQGAERSLLVIDLLHEVGAAVDLGGHNLTSHLLNTSVGLVQAQLLQQAAGNQQTSGVGGGVVLQTDGQAVSGQLLRAGLAQHLITNDLSIDDLAQHVAVGEADNQAVLGGLVLVLVLSDQLVALTVVSAAICKQESECVLIDNSTQSHFIAAGYVLLLLLNFTWKVLK